jgi:twitching motility protein PilT
MTLHQLLELTIARQASDLHIVANFHPQLRINGELFDIPGSEVVTGQQVEQLIFPYLTPAQKNILLEKWELDLGIQLDKNRFRANLYKASGNFAGAFRLIPESIRPLDSLGLPTSLYKIPELKQGLVLVTGPTGHGKSTTLASFINSVNLTRDVHIVTIEDPIEYLYPKAKSLVSQRELETDTKSWGNALRSALREDPDVVLIGEMRDLETISSAITIAETGHLVFATLHTNSASQTVDRIIDVFPVDQQPQIRIQLAAVLEAVISQRLIPTITPGRALAYEVLIGVPALRSIIRDDKTHLIDNLIQTSAEAGMVSLETALATLVREGKISIEVAQTYALRPGLVNKLLGFIPRS